MTPETLRVGDTFVLAVAGASGSGDEWRVDIAPNDAVGICGECDLPVASQAVAHPVDPANEQQWHLVCFIRDFGEGYEIESIQPKGTGTRAFKYYLHDDYSASEFAEWVFDDQLKLGLSRKEKNELMAKIERPFYDVEFDCTLDLETGHVTFALTEGQGT